MKFYIFDIRFSVLSSISIYTSCLCVFVVKNYSDLFILQDKKRADNNYPP